MVCGLLALFFPRICLFEKFQTILKIVSAYHNAYNMLVIKLQLQRTVSNCTLIYSQNFDVLLPAQMDKTKGTKWEMMFYQHPSIIPQQQQSACFGSNWTLRSRSKAGYQACQHHSSYHGIKHDIDLNNLSHNYSKFKVKNKWIKRIILWILVKHTTNSRKL